MRGLLIAGNWKMNTTISSAGELASKVRPGLESVQDVEKVVCPPFVSLAAVAAVLKGSSIGLGAQNMHFDANGAYTGEISPTMLAGLCQYVIIGHSERRMHFGESDALIGRKVKAALATGLRPILCVGERLEEREEGLAKAIVEQQVVLDLARLSSIGNLVIAYEPVWAIGTGRAATTKDAQDMMSHIRSTVAKCFGEKPAEEIKLLYGGSVNAENVASFVEQKDVDGALVGGASLKADVFVQLTKNAAAAR